MQLIVFQFIVITGMFRTFAKVVLQMAPLKKVKGKLTINFHNLYSYTVGL